MAGRAGRRTPHSRVIVQTYSRDHYVLQTASQHDVMAFYQHELAFRREYRYPPFVRMIRFAVRRATDEECALEADSLVRALGHHAHERGVTIDIVGPAPAFIARIRGDAQWHLILKTAPESLDRLLDNLPHPPGWVADVDPVSLL
jgi:primosomal protein N' (replication factor Y)